MAFVSVAYHDFRNIRSEKRFAPADIEYVNLAHGAEYSFNFIQGQFFPALGRIFAVQLPDVAGSAF